MAKREVEGFLGDRQLIFKLTFQSFVQSMQKDPVMLPDSCCNIPRYSAELLSNRLSNQELAVSGNNNIDVEQ
jgi:hypothetical protein